MKSKFLKKLSAALAAVMIAVCLVSCAGPNDSSSSSSQSTSSQHPKTKVNVAVLKGPTALGMLKLMSDSKEGCASNDYTFETFSSADQVVPNIVNGSIDIAAIPTNVAAALYKKTEKNVSIIAVNTLGVLSVLTNGVEISSVADLKGKTIYATGQGATPEYALNYILEKNGLKVGEDVKIEYKAEHSELAALMISGEVKIAMLPQPFVANVITKNSNVKIALDLSNEWAKIPDNNGSELVMGCLVARKDFLKNNKAAVDAFLNEYSASTYNANENIEQTSELADDFGIMVPEIVAKALPYCNIVYRVGDEMKSSVSSYLNVLYNANPQSVGGEIPDDNFYYEK